MLLYAIEKIRSRITPTVNPNKDQNQNANL